MVGYPTDPREYVHKHKSNSRRLCRVCGNRIVKGVYHFVGIVKAKGGYCHYYLCYRCIEALATELIARMPTIFH